MTRCGLRMIISLSNCPDAYVVAAPESAKQLVRESLARRRGYHKKKHYMVGCGDCDVCETGYFLSKFETLKSAARSNPNAMK